MPETFTWNEFGAGWCPSDDATNGRRNALLAMDNLELDQNGALTLAGGTTALGPSSGTVHTLFSNVLNGVRHDYFADSGGFIIRDFAGLASGGSPTLAAFGVAFDFTLIASGATRLKDDGTGPLLNLGVTKPSAGIAATEGHYETVSVVKSTDALIIGGLVPHGDLSFTLYNNGSGLTPDTAILQTVNLVASPVNFSSLLDATGAGSPADETGDDILSINLIIDEGLIPGGTTSLTFTDMDSFVVDVLLEQPDNIGTKVNNYFTQAIQNDGTYDGLIAIQAQLKRSNFVRVGTINSWQNVYGMRFTLTAKSGAILQVRVYGKSIGVFPQSFQFRGGTKSLLDGDYEWTQVNVNNTGSYLAKSEKDPFDSNGVLHLTQEWQANLSYAFITPHNPTTDDPQCNEAWIYRRGGQLGRWYRVAVVQAPWAVFEDNLSDQDVLTLGITLDEGLVSINAVSIPDPILAIVGPVEGRWFYFTQGFMYPSDLNDPDLINPGLGVKFTGGASEIFLWAQKVSDNSVMIGTSRDVYLLTGTFATLPDGSIDIYLRSLGCKFPPVTYDSSSANGSTYYLAADGWREIGPDGGNPLLVAPNTDRLYRGITAYGYSVNSRIIPGSTRFPCVLARNKLWCGIAGRDRIEVYDFVRKYWRPVLLGLGSVTAICSTPDGNIVAAFTNNQIHQLDRQDSHLVGGATQQTVRVLSPVFDCGSPKQRKEFYTVKFKANTAFAPIALTLNDENGVPNLLGNFSSGALSEFFIGILGNFPFLKSIQFEFSGPCNQFILENFSIEYDTRPVQLTRLHILPNNFGTVARKRICTIPYMIDTMGSDAFLTVLVDGNLIDVQSIATIRKQSLEYEFTNQVLTGVDYEFILNSQGVFEFFGFQEPKHIELFPEPTKAYTIPTTNYGSTARKRIRVQRFFLNTKNSTVFYTPYIDGIPQTPSVFSPLDSPKTYYHYYQSDEIGVDFSGTLDAGAGDFELWEVYPPDQQDIEVFPERLKFFVLPVTNYGSTARKRVRLLKFVLDPLDTTVEFSPIIDGNPGGSAAFFTGPGKRTVYYYYTEDKIGVDFSGIFTSAGGSEVFELWAIIPPEKIDIEEFPDRLEFYITPKNNFGSDSRKRIQSWTFVADAHSGNLIVTAVLDGIDALIFSDAAGTNGKQTFHILFDPDQIGVDFELRFESDVPFELWDVKNPDQGEIEIFPEPLLFHTVPTTNFGNAQKKRVRVWPFVIDTKSQNVTFTPEVDDGVVFPGLTFSTPTKNTVRYYFDHDVFGVDYSGTFQSQGGRGGMVPFELWGMLPPDIVQILPIARHFDQVGPEDLFKYGKIKQIELRLLAFGDGVESTIPYEIFFNDNSNLVGSITVQNGVEGSYLVGMPKGTAGPIVRIELGPTQFDFHRFYMRLQVALSGRDTELKWITLGEEDNPNAR